MQLHNHHVMANIVDEKGKNKLLFLGFEETEGRGSEAHVTALRKSVERVMPWKELFPRVTSIVTDGENMNTGEHKGIWKLLTDERVASGETLPLLKIWCAVHRINLAWKDITKNVQEVSSLIQAASGLCAFYHSSEQRTKGLTMVASEKNLEVLQNFHSVCSLLS